MVIVLTLYPVHIQVLISIMKHVLAAGFPTSFESWFMSPDGGGGVELGLHLRKEQSYV